MTRDHWESFEKPTDAQAERLAMLAEEAAEIAQAVTKASRHGLECHHPATQVVNSHAIAHEVEDLLCIILAMVRQGDIAPIAGLTATPGLNARWEEKLFFTHSQEDGQDGR